MDNYDICYSYKYYEEKGILKIECDAGTGTHTPTKIEVISQEEDTLILKFNENKKTFITKKHLMNYQKKPAMMKIYNFYAIKSLIPSIDQNVF